MKVAIIYNQDLTGVINRFGMQNKEIYNPNTVKMVAEALEKGGHNVKIIDGNMHLIENLTDFMPRVMEGERMGMVFNMAYGIQGESRYTHLPAMLEMMGIPYVGSGPTGHAMALDKVITKVLLQKHNIPTPDFCVLSRHHEDISGVTFPVIVKPKMEAVSYGMKVVHNMQDLREAIKYIVEEFQQQALVEHFVRGREFCVALLGNGDVEAFPIVEIDLGADPDAIQSVDDKKYKPRGKICPPDLPDDLAESIVAISKKCFHALELKDFARVDLRMDGKGSIYVLEINSMASLGKTGSYVHAAGAAGMDYATLVNSILDVASVRYFSRHLPEDEDSRKKSTYVRIRTFLSGRQSRTEKMLEKMVNINTHTRNVEGVNRLGQIIARRLGKLGFSQRVFPRVETGNILFFTNTKEKNYHVLLLNHLDSSVSFRKQRNCRIAEHRIRGTDVWEYKGGLAVLISALQALRFVRKLPRVKIGILLTSDSQVGGKRAEEFILEYSKKAKTVIGLKGGGLKGTAVTSRSGAARYSCQMNLEDGVNAEDVARSVGKFSKILNSWSKLTDESTGVIVTPCDVEINAKVSERTAHGEAILSVRFNDPGLIETIDGKIRKMVKKANRAKFRLQIEGGLKRPPLIKSKESDHLWQRVKSIADRRDIRLLEEHRWSSADICFIQDRSAAIDGMGPVGAEHREGGEFILTHSLIERATLLALTLCDLSTE